MGSHRVRTSFERKQAQFAGIPWLKPRDCQDMISSYDGIVNIYINIYNPDNYTDE